MLMGTTRALKSSAKRIGYLPNGAVIDTPIARFVAWAWHGGEKWSLMLL